MKAFIVIAVSACAVLSLTGCVSTAQINQQTAQLAAINVSLTQIQANQAESIALQKHQVALQGLANGLLEDQQKAQAARK